MTKRLDDLTNTIKHDSIRSMLRSKPFQEVYIDAALETLADYIVRLEGQIEQQRQHTQTAQATNKPRSEF